MQKPKRKSLRVLRIVTNEELHNKSQNEGYEQKGFCVLVCSFEGQGWWNWILSKIWCVVTVTLLPTSQDRRTYVMVNSLKQHTQHWKTIEAQVQIEPHVTSEAKLLTFLRSPSAFEVMLDHLFEIVDLSVITSSSRSHQRVKVISSKAIRILRWLLGEKSFQPSLSQSSRITSKFSSSCSNIPKIGT